MKLILNEEQQMLRDSAKDFAEQKTPVSHFRGLRDNKDPLNWDKEIWKEMVDLGWSGILIPEEFGGSDFGLAGISVIMQEVGKTLTPSPLFATAVLGASAITSFGTQDQKSKYLPLIASGEITTMEEIYDQLADMNLPLICAGGIGSEIELRKALQVGYDGVQMGTRFIATYECSTPDDYKDAIVKAKEDDITWTTKLTGVPISVINNNKFKQHNSWLVRTLLKSRLKHRVRVIITGLSFWRMRAFSKEKNKSSKDLWSAGKSVETVNSIESARIIMERLGQSI